jgi:Protein of unknown function (DUF2793)
MANKKITDLPQTNSISGSNLVHIVQSNTSYKADITTLASYLGTVINIVNAASQVTNIPSGEITSNTVQGALNELDTKKEIVANKSNSFTASSTTTYSSTKALVDGLATKVSSVNGQTGNVNLTTANISESGNLYFTAARSLAVFLAGLSTSINAVITSSDTILSAIGKLQKQISDNLASLLLRGGKDYDFLVGSTADCDYIYNGTNIWVAINSAISALSGPGGGGVIKIKPGTYDLTTNIDLSNKSNVTIIGSGTTTALNATGVGFVCKNTVQVGGNPTRYKNRIMNLYLNGNGSGTALDYDWLSDSTFGKIIINNFNKGIQARGGSYYNNFFDIKIENTNIDFESNESTGTHGVTSYPTAHKFFGCKFLQGTTAALITKGNQIQFYGSEIENFDIHLDFVESLGCGFFGGRLENTDVGTTAVLARLGTNSKNNIIDNPYVAAENWIDRDTHFIDNGQGNSITCIANYKDQFEDIVKSVQVDSPFKRFIRSASGYNSGWGLLELLDRFTNSGNPVTLLTQNNRATGWLFKGIRGVSPRVKPVLDKDLTTPPTSPATGARYIVATSPTGAWAGQTNNIAQWNGSSWTFTTPSGSGNFGTGCWVTDESLYYRFNGTNWISAEMAYITSQGRAWFATGLDNNNQRLLNVATPTNSTDVANKDYVDNPFTWQPSNYNYITWSSDPATISTQVIPTAGVANVVKLRIPRATTISNLILNVGIAGAALNNCYMALYQNGTLLAQSADQSSNWASSGNKVVSLITTFANLASFPVTGEATKLYQAVDTGLFYRWNSSTSAYVSSTPINVSIGTVDAVFWANGTTLPSIARGSGASGLNGGLTGTNLRFSTADTGLTTVAPATLGARTTLNAAYWVALS